MGVMIQIPQDTDQIQDESPDAWLFHKSRLFLSTFERLSFECHGATYVPKTNILLPRNSQNRLEAPDATQLTNRLFSASAEVVTLIRLAHVNLNPTQIVTLQLRPRVSQNEIPSPPALCPGNQPLMFLPNVAEIKKRALAELASPLEAL